MTKPQRYIFRMIVFLLIAGGVVGALYEVVLEAFLHNPALNGVIVGTLLFGIIYGFRRVLILKPEVRWIEGLRGEQAGFSLRDPPRLLTPLAGVLREHERRGRSSLAAGSMRYLLENLSHRLDESRDISRYLISLLVFLGLLGTFWGLVTTIGSVSGVIAGLSIGENDDPVAGFDQLKEGLVAPLSGMGIAFSSSLFGLAGSLVLGFLDLQANQAQGTFYDELEQWLAGLSRFGAGAGGGLEGDGSVPGYIQALLEQTADNLDNLQRLVARGEEERAGAGAGQAALTDRLAAIGDQMAAQHGLLTRMVEGQEAMRPMLGRLGQGNALDDATRTHIRNLDVLMNRLLDETARGRTQMTQELRSEIKTVSRTIAHVAGDPRAAAGE